MAKHFKPKTITRVKTHIIKKAARILHLQFPRSLYKQVQFFRRLIIHGPQWAMDPVFFHLSKMLSGSNRLHQRDKRICTVDDPCFPTGRRNDGQRPHVLADDLLLLFTQLKIALGIGQGKSWMTKTMHAVPLFFLMPVIQIIIMEKRTSDQFILTAANMQFTHPQKTVICDQQTVIISRNIAMLNKLFHLQQPFIPQIEDQTARRLCMNLFFHFASLLSPLSIPQQLIQLHKITVQLSVERGLLCCNH